ncbi:MAG TPA: class I SAM-dependent methyltransferase, partial [Gaiellales bacterium]|nr:class I SAM-dependent methyltransferase [Gaiellales bacterium]
IAELAGVGPGHHVLKVGTRWGGMAREQYDLARERVAASGVGQLVDVQLCDYRDLRRRFDRIVSIEMFEAVGEEHWPTFFAACDGLLVPGGHMVMQPITMPHRRYLASRRSHGWIHEYIFPGGLIPPRRRSMPPPRGGRRCG